MMTPSTDCVPVVVPLTLASGVQRPLTGFLPKSKYQTKVPLLLISSGGVRAPVPYSR
jgi:hypothetical protein